MGGLGLIETALAVTSSPSRIVWRMGLPRSDQVTEGKSAGGNSLLASEFETARKLESERIGLSLNMVCDLLDEIVNSSGAVN